MVNKYLPHVLVLPEDDANLQLANEFHLQINGLRQMQLLEVAGGWVEVLNLFERVHVREMERCQHRFMILLIDFDSDWDRLRIAKDRIPPALKDRVYILGVWSEPEGLRTNLSASYKDIGSLMADDCRRGTNEIWGKPLLQHNAGELQRLRQYVVPRILFPT